MKATLLEPTETGHNPAPNKRVQKPMFQPVAIKHEQAFELYCQLPDMSLKEFTRTLNDRGIEISCGLVQKWSSKYKWLKRRAALKNEGPASLLSSRERITRLDEMAEHCKRETVNGLLVQIVETLSGNLSQIEIKSTADAHSMIELANKVIELRDTVEPPQSKSRSLIDRSAYDGKPVSSIGSFRDKVVAGGTVPGM